MGSSVAVDIIGRAYPETDFSPSLAQVEDRYLIEGLQQGVERAYELLIARFQQPVYNLALRLTSNPSDAGDIAQEVFLKVFRNIQTFRGQSSLRTWIYRIAVNEAHNHRRWNSRHRHNEVELDDHPPHSASCERALPDDDPSPFDRALNGERHVLIEQALARINPCFREAVVLRDIEDLNYDEIADILAISIGTVKSRILRGREALRNQLRDAMRPRTMLMGQRV